MKTFEKGKPNINRLLDECFKKSIKKITKLIDSKLN